MGGDGNYLDNIHAGGLCVGIKDNGCADEIAYKMDI